MHGYKVLIIGCVTFTLGVGLLHQERFQAVGNWMVIAGVITVLVDEVVWRVHTLRRR